MKQYMKGTKIQIDVDDLMSTTLEVAVFVVVVVDSVEVDLVEVLEVLLVLVVGASVVTIVADFWMLLSMKEM